MMTRNEVLGMVFVGLLFVLAAWVSNTYAQELERWLDIGALGMVVYVALGFIATVLAPVTTLPLIPVAVVLWGPFATGLLSVTGWFLGSLAAFAIARRWGRPIVARFVPLETLAKYEEMLGTRQRFLTIMLLRMAVPVDVLSYALGLFSGIGWPVYAGATLLGIIPFAFFFSYISEVSFALQAVAFLLVLVVLFVTYRSYLRLRVPDARDDLR